MTRLLFAALVALASLGGNAYAADTLACALSTELWGPHPWFRNAGAYTPAATSLTAEGFCKHSSGFYGDLWAFGPIGEPFKARYGEFDTRVGWNGSVGGGFSLDVSAAEYHFQIPGFNPTAINNSWDGRAKVMYETTIAGVTIAPYLGFDAQRWTEIHANAAAVFGGVTFGYDLTKELRLSVNADAWQWSAQHRYTTNQHAVVWSVEPKLTYSLDKSDKVWVAYTFGQGNLFDGTDHKTRSLYKVGYSHAF